MVVVIFCFVALIFGPQRQQGETTDIVHSQTGGTFNVRRLIGLQKAVLFELMHLLR
jgi:hypothetical protein